MGRFFRENVLRSWNIGIDLTEIFFFCNTKKKRRVINFFCVSRQTEALEMLSKCQRKSFFVFVLVLTLLKKFLMKKFATKLMMNQIITELILSCI